MTINQLVKQIAAWIIIILSILGAMDMLEIICPVCFGR